jgi:hypothetical protein
MQQYWWHFKLFYTEEYGFLACNTVQLEVTRRFEEHIVSIFRIRTKTSKKPAEAGHKLKMKCYMFPRNVGLPPNCMVLQPRRKHPPQWVTSEAQFQRSVSCLPSTHFKQSSSWDFEIPSYLIFSWDWKRSIRRCFSSNLGPRACFDSEVISKLWVLLDIWLDTLDGGSVCFKASTHADNSTEKYGLTFMPRTALGALA